MLDLLIKNGQVIMPGVGVEEVYVGTSIVRKGIVIVKERREKNNQQPLSTGSLIKEEVVRKWRKLFASRDLQFRKKVFGGTKFLCSSA